MEIKGAIDADSTVVQQYPFNGGANQIWKLVKDKEGTYRIYTKLGSKTRVLDVKRLGTTDGTPIQIYTPNDSDGQRFILEYAGGDAYRIVPNTRPTWPLAPTGGSQGRIPNFLLF